MFLVAETNNTKVTFALMPRNYTGLYNKLKTLLSPEEMFLFARPDSVGDTTQWSLELPDDLQPGKVRSFDQLTEEEKDSAADYLENLKGKVAKKLQNDAELSGILKTLFALPSSRDIKIISTDYGIKAVLTQWGCKSNEVNSEVDPLAFVINRPRTTTAKVIIAIQYSDGTIAANKTFHIDYLGSSAKEKTNKEGFYDRGRCRLDSSFEVYDIVDGKKCYVHQFDVTPNGSYTAVFPFLTNGSIRVVDQLGNQVQGAGIIVEVDSNEKKLLSGSSGQVNLEALESGKSITFWEEGRQEEAQLQTIGKDGNQWTLTVHRAQMVDASVRVADENDEIQLKYSLQFEYNDRVWEDNTGDTGILALGKLETGKSIKITSKSQPSFSKSFEIGATDNDFVLQVTKPIKQVVRVKLINHKNEAMPGIGIDFNAINLKTKETTDEKGTCYLPHESLSNGEKVRASIHLIEQKKDKIKERVLTKKFKFKNEQLEYTLKLRKFNWWWLLLLLPLLLLIQCEKTVYVKTVDAQSGKPAANVNVQFGYNRAFLYNDKRFLPVDWMDMQQATSQNGIAEFPALRFSVYSFIFHHYSSALAYANTTCYASDTITPVFHHIWDKDTIKLSLSPVTIALDFLIVDKEDGMPLPDATVDIVAEHNGSQYTESAVSGPDGRVVFDKIPKCAKINSVRAEADGYYPDSLLDKTVDALLQGPVDPNRTLKLTPKKGQFSFFVIDCKSKKPIAGATVTIEIDYNGKKSTKTKRTNVDGKGKGFEEDYLIAKIHLLGKAPYYKSGELAGWHSIKDFINPAIYPDDKRTFCLEPEENCVTFLNIDEKTTKPLSGVKNVVSIKNGSNTRVDTVYSQRDGSFPVCGIVVGDVVSIHAQYPPDYEDNNTTVSNKDGIGLTKSSQKDRTIPLKPKEVELTFRTLDASDGSLVGDAALSVTLDGQPMPLPNNSGQGEFTIKAPVTSIISISSSKSGYGSNSTTINQKAVKMLQPPTPQAERDIPLMKDPPPPPPPPPSVPATPCDVPVKSSQGTSGEMYFNLGAKDYDFRLEYDMDGHADEIIIYCGKGTSGKILFRRTASHSNGSPQFIHFDAKACDGIITVLIEPTDNDQSSVWDFNISCPD